MTIELLKQQIEKKLSELRAYARDDAPIAIGGAARNEFLENFDKQGFDGKKWQNVKRRDPNSPWYGLGQTRQFSQERTSAPILTGETGELKQSISYQEYPYRVIITNEKEYAQVHNEGFDGKVTVPPKTRKSHTVKEHKRKTKTKVVEVKSHERKEHDVKQHTRHLQIPKRQFIGITPKLKKSIQDKIERDITKIINS